MRNRVSPIWMSSKDEFQDICRQCHSLAQIIRSFGLEAEAGNYNTLKKRIQEDGIDVSHIKLGLNSNRGRRFVRKYTQENIVDAINKGVIKDNSTVRKMVLKWDLISHKVCAICGRKPKWNGMPLTFVLDHINGKHSDHNLNNLRFICPNCNSQTPTFSGRNRKCENGCDNTKARRTAG